MVRHAQTLAVTTAVALLATAAISVAAAPGPRAPTDGKRLNAGTPFTFKVRSSPSGHVFLKVSKSKRKNSRGTLRTNVYLRKMIRRADGMHTKKTETYPALDSYFLNRPGTYYWQAYRIDCAEQSDCEVESRIRRFVIR